MEERTLNFQIMDLIYLEKNKYIKLVKQGKRGTKYLHRYLVLRDNQTFKLRQNQTFIREF